MADDLDGPELDAMISDLIALVTLNLDASTAESNEPTVLAMQLLLIQPGETAQHWMLRVVRMLDMATYMAATWLRAGARARGVPPEISLRFFAQEWAETAAGRHGNSDSQ